LCTRTRRRKDPDELSIICDNVGAGRLAVEHLIACGRTRIAHISGDPRYAAARDRAEGVLTGLADAGLSQVGDVWYSSWSEAWGRAAAAMLLDRIPMSTRCSAAATKWRAESWTWCGNAAVAYPTTSR
jgi:DNA-binding LacI/PurR family transcriptional regulator